MASVFDYQFNVGGNFTAAMDGMVESTGRFNATVESSVHGLSAWGQKSVAFGLISDYMDRASRSLQELGSTWNSAVWQQRPRTSVSRKRTQPYRSCFTSNKSQIVGLCWWLNDNATLIGTPFKNTKTYRLRNNLYYNAGFTDIMLVKV